MQSNLNNKYNYIIDNPNMNYLGYIIAVAKIDDKHDRSTPSHYHWKILKCRMILFSNSSVLACPDKNDIKKVHVVFNKTREDYNKLTSLFVKFSLHQESEIKNATPEIFQMCLEYTMTAKIAPVWNTLGYNYLINNRNFLTTKGPQNGIQYFISSNESKTKMQLKPVKINLLLTDEIFSPYETIRVLPSLYKATVEEHCESLPENGLFKSYREIRRHWKNIHGYRLPDEEGTYYSIQFWRGEPLTYPKICVLRNFPVITPMPKAAEISVLTNFHSCLKNKMGSILGQPLKVQHDWNSESIDNRTCCESQGVSLCTPTQYK